MPLSSSNRNRLSLRSVSTSLPALATVLLFLTPSIHAQVGTILDKSKLPACAFNCQTLLNAQSVCVPPSAPTTSQAIYQTCFCNSNYLVQFKQSPTDICAGGCTAAELQTIQTWFTGLCAAGAAVVTPAGGTTTSTSTTAGSTATGTSSSSQQNSSKTAGTSNSSWISTHYRWIIMIIVLFIAAIVAITLGLWLKRRKRTQHDLPNRDSTLGVEDAVASMRSRHPETGSMAQLPAWERASVAMSSRERIAGTPPLRVASGLYASTPTPPPLGHGHGYGKGKTRQEAVEAQTMHGAIGEDGAEASMTNPARSTSQRLKKKTSKKGRS